MRIFERTIGLNQLTLCFFYLEDSAGDPVEGATSFSGYFSQEGTGFASLSGDFYGIGLGWYFYVPASGDTTVAGNRLILIDSPGAERVAILLRIVGYQPEDNVRLGLSAIPQAIAGDPDGLPVLDGSGNFPEVELSSNALNAVSAAIFQADPYSYSGGSYFADMAIGTYSAIGDMSMRVGTPAVTLSEDIAAVKADTAGLAGETPSLPGDAMTLTSAYDVYVATIDVSVDNANDQDEYTVAWFKNGVLLTSGITSPEIQVIKRSNGTDLIAADDMTEVPSTGTYKYDEDTDRIMAGEAVLVRVTAEIDGQTRQWQKIVSRDSIAP